MYYCQSLQHHVCVCIWINIHTLWKRLNKQSLVGQEDLRTGTSPRTTWWRFERPPRESQAHTHIHTDTVAEWIITVGLHNSRDKLRSTGDLWSVRTRLKVTGKKNWSKMFQSSLLNAVTVAPKTFVPEILGGTKKNYWARHWGFCYCNCVSLFLLWFYFCKVLVLLLYLPPGVHRL